MERLSLVTWIALWNSPLHFSEHPDIQWHTRTHLSVKNLGVIKTNSKERELVKRGRTDEGGEEKDGDKTVHGDRRPQGTGDVEKQTQVLSNVPNSHSCLSFFSSFASNSCKTHFFQISSLFNWCPSRWIQLGQWRYKCRCHYQAKRASNGELKG